MEVNCQEKDWVVYLFKDGDVFGLNINSMWSFIDYLIVFCMKQCGFLCLIIDVLVKYLYFWICEYFNFDNV